MSKAGLIIKAVMSVWNIKRKLDRSAFDKPSFYIHHHKRMGTEADLEIVIRTKEEIYYTIEKIIFKTIDSAESELGYKNNLSELTVKIPQKIEFFDTMGYILIEYRLKNKSKHISRSPEIHLTKYKYKEILEDEEYPMNITSEITNQFFK